MTFEKTKIGALKMVCVIKIGTRRKLISYLYYIYYYKESNDFSFHQLES